MTDYKKIVEDRSCNSGCNTSKWCMCSLAEDMAEEIERLRTTFDKIADVLVSKELTDWEQLNEIEDLTRSVFWENKQ